jgi:hypothetical protein
MGYTTDFEGKFELNKTLDSETHDFLTKLAETRRMKRNADVLQGDPVKYGFDSWGTEGEFFVDGGGFAGQDRDKSIIDYNMPPRTQPGLWCQWVPTEDGMAIVWDGNEKFYNYTQWLEYIIAKVLAPRGYVLNGMVEWQGEDSEDFGQLKVEDNKVLMRYGEKTFGEWQ